MNSFYVFDINNKRLPNFNEKQIHDFYNKKMGFWINKYKSFRVITKENLNQFKKQNCDYCGASYQLNVIRNKIFGKKEYNHICHSQFATVCSSCVSKYNNLTPHDFEYWINSQMSLVEDFKKRYSIDKIALVTKYNKRTNIIGYIDTKEIEPFLRRRLGSLNSIASTLSLIVNTENLKKRSKNRMNSFFKLKRKINELFCVFCGATEKLSVDHKIPLSKGGLDIESNYCIACVKCNEDKNTMTFDEYQSYLREKGKK